MMFCGLCGNGNTTWAKALLSLVSGLYTIDRPYYHALRGTTLHYLTTNLTPSQLEEKYGKRIVDRLNEMVEKVVFENESYRR